ncbi:hypothetical protein TEA_029453 [Camellia sinensis var. sinensis]|uniref:AB hydrolase-1 domain-containing protein n=1 Tax=Camellia sinensis var. sinensis TaxID=542762 RepID=A0A4S4ETT0_CAMSN|nr:hypothetical protein TEA_029453 [Camellia sinensis var. sinensis]
MVSLTLGFPLIGGANLESGTRSLISATASGGGGAGFPSFLPKEVHKIKDPFARTLAQRIQRLPVQIEFSESCIMSSCVKPIRQCESNPVVLLHCFDRCTYPLLEEAGLEVWAVDVLGWGFSDLEPLPPCNAATKRYHLYQLWKTHIKRPMILVGPSLGGAVAIDFAVNYPEAVEKLVLINASVYAEGTGLLTKLPTIMAYAVVKHKALIIGGECDNIVCSKLVMRLHCELPNSIMRQIPDCGHLPHVEKPNAIAKLITDFAQERERRDRDRGGARVSSGSCERKREKRDRDGAYRDHDGAMVSTKSREREREVATEQIWMLCCVDPISSLHLSSEIASVHRKLPVLS